MTVHGIAGAPLVAATMIAIQKTMKVLDALSRL
jgi:hypothetical protein